LVIQKDDFRKYYEKSSMLRNIWTNNIEYHYLGMEERVFSLIALNADQRYGLFCNQYPGFIKKVPQKYIASMLGIEPRHLSRIRKKIVSGNK